VASEITLFSLIGFPGGLSSLIGFREELSSEILPSLIGFRGELSSEIPPSLIGFRGELSSEILPSLIGFRGELSSGILPSLIGFPGELSSEILPSLIGFRGELSSEILPSLIGFPGELSSGILPSLIGFRGELSSEILPSLIGFRGELSFETLLSSARALAETTLRSTTLSLLDLVSTGVFERTPNGVGERALLSRRRTLTTGVEPASPLLRRCRLPTRTTLTLPPEPCFNTSLARRTRCCLSPAVRNRGDDALSSESTDPTVDESDASRSSVFASSWGASTSPKGGSSLSNVSACREETTWCRSLPNARIASNSSRTQAIDGRDLGFFDNISRISRTRAPGNERGRAGTGSCVMERARAMSDDPRNG
jgi:hypothetical protein